MIKGGIAIPSRRSLGIASREIGAASTRQTGKAASAFAGAGISLDWSP
jgi:hypothetical protein